eukprot:m.64939 g.64939  ORF g.64939 m.64939 type:complete len:304 (+) comp49760_c0_seq1:133-1044(+)
MPPKTTSAAKRPKRATDANAEPTTQAASTTESAATAHPAISRVAGHSHEQIKVIADFLLARTTHRPYIAIICGSGLGGLADTIEDKQVFDFHDIPGFPVSTVAGHAGRLVFGTIAGKEVVCMQGRLHFYEGYSIHTTTLPVRVLHLLGAKILIVTNAAGGLNPAFNVGDIMILKDHINLMGMAGLTGLLGSNDPLFGPRFPPMNRAYDRNLQQLARQSAHELGFDDFTRSGVYVFLSGPSYETPTEAHFLRTVGADACGMSTASEVVVAVHCGLSVRMTLFSLVASGEGCLMEFVSCRCLASH